MKKAIYLGNTQVNETSGEVNGGFTTIGSEKFYKISNYNKMQDFFMTIVSNSDHWMFLSSNGSLTAGRKSRDMALFPYYTVDKIHDFRGKTGSSTFCIIEKDEQNFLWEPFSHESEKAYRIERNIYKSIYGNKIVFEEINHDLNTIFSYGWYNSDKYGWIKRSELKNTGHENIRVGFLDGIRNIIPWGVDYAFQNEYSNLLDAYKKSELLQDSSLALFMLSSIPVDRAEPSEALRATAVWSAGLPEETKILISDKQIHRFIHGNEVAKENDVRASKGAYFVNNTITLEPQTEKHWYIIADVAKDSADVVNLNYEIQGNKQIEKAILDDIRIGTLALKRIVGSSDGLQMSNEELGYARHFSNTLFNVMRGGIFTDDYHINPQDLKKYISQTNKSLAKKYNSEIALFTTKIEYSELLQWAKGKHDPDLERVCTEYLPLTFSRRHGDPSRPWNQFSIEVKEDNGEDKLSYEGNWRDIFQNWEALSMAFPEFIEAMITRFANATTADGYNPYRITREGIDWEESDPDDPWSYIGYWGDHQVIYLQKFLELSNAYHPGKIAEMLTADTFVFASVPYKIKPFDKMLINPKDTIAFDQDLNKTLHARANVTGADGKLLTNYQGDIIRTNFTEKILVSLLTKLYNFIPEAGIWLNTQRPEWNDANNALVGNGASMVTLYYLRRSLTFWVELLNNSDFTEANISEELYELFEEMQNTFNTFKNNLETGFSDENRYLFSMKMGTAGSVYRENIYLNSFSGKRKKVSGDQITSYFSLALQYLNQSIEKNKRTDGLYHAYNLVSFSNGKASIRYLYEMLEGQVAVLSSGYLDAKESLSLLNALKGSPLFRPDQYSYILYPDRELPRFTKKNSIPRKKAEEIGLLQKLLADKNTDIIKADVLGNIHFDSNCKNADRLNELLDALPMDLYGKKLKEDKASVLNLYEEIFDHHSFTGRSGTFYGYEGLGSIYWHMVSKLLLATQESFFSAVEAKADEITLGKLQEHYYEIKAGIGLYKNPALYGAFPTDAYSHTPGNSGVKQPGLTGQVKEDIISRFGELGLKISNGKIYFNPTLLNADEILTKKDVLSYFNLRGDHCQAPLNPGQIAFTFCQVPVICSFGDSNVIAVEYQDGTIREFRDKVISTDISNSIFSRKGEIKQIHFHAIL